MPSSSNLSRPTTMTTIETQSKWVTPEEKRKQRRREASRRYYQNNPAIREKKRQQTADRRAAAKAAKRRWDPPKKPKPVPRREDPNEGAFPSEDENILSAQEDNTTKTWDDACIQDEYEIQMETGEYRHTTRAVHPYFYYYSCRQCIGEYYGLLCRRPERGRLTVLPDDKSQAAIDVLVESREALTKTSPASMEGQDPALADTQGDEGTPTISGAEMSECCSSAESPVSWDKSAPAIAVVIENSGMRDDPAAPPPEGAIPPAKVFRADSSGICGHCKTVNVCNNGGEDQEGLCARCLDCEMWGYACWDHFNDVKDWEESWLW
ncbi:hypothetical protein DFH09DRAFT_1092834 [Mycena vulgaris]|nr:hypothetical protein DFH09DRAFT_1092834 [Mycena vulgaris]